MILDAALAYLFQNESADYVNDPLDSGGPTKFGITQKAYISFLGRWVTPAEIEALTESDAYVFYKARYWEPLKCDRIADPAVAIALFDTGVLYGVGTAALLAQKALSWCGATLKFDGLIGDKSITAFNLVRREEFIPALHQFVLHRIESVIKLDSKNERFRHGWKNRADRLLTLSTQATFNKEVT